MFKKFAISLMAGALSFSASAKDTAKASAPKATQDVPKDTAATPAGKEAPKAIEIRLSTKGNDISFDKSSIEVAYSKKITITFSNEAEGDSHILHNIAILEPNSTDEVIEALQKANYDLEVMKKHKKVIAMTKALNPGEKETLSFQPKGKGYYPYICIMAGHGDMMDMKGLLHLK